MLWLWRHNCEFVLWKHPMGKSDKIPRMPSQHACPVPAALLYVTHVQKVDKNPRCGLRRGPTQSWEPGHTPSGSPDAVWGWRDIVWQNKLTPPRWSCMGEDTRSEQQCGAPPRHCSGPLPSTRGSPLSGGPRGSPVGIPNRPLNSPTGNQGRPESDTWPLPGSGPQTWFVLTVLLKAGISSFSWKSKRSGNPGPHSSYSRLVRSGHCGLHQVGCARPVSPAPSPSSRNLSLDEFATSYFPGGLSSKEFLI